MVTMEMSNTNSALKNLTDFKNEKNPDSPYFIFSTVYCENEEFVIFIGLPQLIHTFEEVLYLLCK